MTENEKLCISNCNCIAILDKEEFDESYWYDSLDCYKGMYIESFLYDEMHSIYLPIWYKFNKEFNLMIDYCEEEILPNKHLKRAKEILVEFLKGNITQVQRATAEKVLRVVQKAIDCDTFVEFEF